jgi:hypothetical protein
MSGASGVASRVAKMEPIVVSPVRSRVAKVVLKSAPARTFCERGHQKV